jgi:hypothetical protein
MRRKEVPRAGLLEAARAGKISNAQGAGSMRVSLRQFQRVKARFAEARRLQPVCAVRQGHREGAFMSLTARGGPHHDAAAGRFRQFAAFRAEWARAPRCSAPRR